MIAPRYNDRMRRFGLGLLVLAIVAAASAAGVLLVSRDDGGGGEPPASAPPPATRESQSGLQGHEAHDTGRDGSRRQVREAVAQSQPARLDETQRRVAGVVRAYVAALDARDGARVCQLFVPGALTRVEFPRDRGTCAPSLEASIGYRDPRGFPVYAASRVARVPGVAIDDSEARVTATTVTRFADNREPSVEDDVVYLRSRGGRWLIAKPSATLYRAIGVGDIPPQALAPP